MQGWPLGQLTQGAIQSNTPDLKTRIADEERRCADTQITLTDTTEAGQNCDWPMPQVRSSHMSFDEDCTSGYRILETIWSVK